MRAPAPLTTERYGLGESPVWDDRAGRILWASINDGEIHSTDAEGRDHKAWNFGEAVASFGLCRSGRFVVALVNDVILFDPETGAREVIAHISHEIAGMRLNDGKVGPDGAFWVGSTDARPVKGPVSKLYRVTADGGVTTKVEGLKVSNGLAWTADGRTMFHSDSRGPWLERWDFDPATGAMSNRRRIADLTEAEGRPDGGACDAEGNYWSGGVSAGVLNCFAPDGRLLSRLPMPVQWPTMPCFGGPELRTLYVTSLRDGEAARELDGAVVTLPAPVAGAPVHRFAD